MILLLLCLSTVTAFTPKIPQNSIKRSDSGSDISTRKWTAFKASSLEVGLDNLFSEPNNSTSSATSTMAPPPLNTGNHDDDDDDSLPEDMLILPRHSSGDVNEILIETENLIKNMHKHSKHVDATTTRGPKARQQSYSQVHDDGDSDEYSSASDYDAIFANTYVDLGKVDTVGFDYDYTLVTYTEELLELIYDMALKRLVNDRNYPLEMLDAGLVFDPFFSIRGAKLWRTCLVFL